MLISFHIKIVISFTRSQVPHRGVQKSVHCSVVKLCSLQLNTYKFVIQLLLLSSCVTETIVFLLPRPLPEKVISHIEMNVESCCLLTSRRKFN